MNQNDENLQRLLQQFVEGSQAESMVDDFRYADAVFDAHPAPPAPRDALARLGRHVGIQLAAARQRRILLRWSSTAAAVVLVLAGLVILNSGIQTTTRPDKISVQVRPVRLDGFFSSGLHIADIESDINELFKAFEGIDTAPYHETIDTLQFDLNEIEDQFIASNTEFWKG